MKEFKNNAFDILLERGFVFQATHLEETKKLLESGPITFYLGIDHYHQFLVHNQMYHLNEQSQMLA